MKTTVEQIEDRYDRWLHLDAEDLPWLIAQVKMLNITVKGLEGKLAQADRLIERHEAHLPGSRVWRNSAWKGGTP